MIKGIFKAAFPFISAAASIGGPLGTMAAAAVGKAIGVADIPAGGIAEVIAAATSKDPEAMAKLRQAEREFQLRMAEIGFDNVEKLEDIAAQDRANARAREIALRDRIPAILAITVTVGFFSFLAVLTFQDIPDGTETLLIAMLGGLGGAFTGIVNYYFGSSAGSAEKTKLMANGK